MKRIYSDKENVHAVPNIALLDGTSNVLIVTFKDSERSTYWWIPKWSSIRDLFEDAYHTEVENNAGEEKEFVRTAFKVIKSELERRGSSSDKLNLINELESEMTAFDMGDTADIPPIFKSNPNKAHLVRTKTL